MINVSLIKESNIPSIRTKDGILHYAAYIERKYAELMKEYKELVLKFTLLTVGKSKKLTKAVDANENLVKKLHRARFRIRRLREESDTKNLKIFLAGVGFANNCKQLSNTILVDLNEAEKVIKQTIENE